MSKSSISLAQNIVQNSQSIAALLLQTRLSAGLSEAQKVRIRKIQLRNGSHQAFQFTLTVLEKKFGSKKLHQIINQATTDAATVSQELELGSSYLRTPINQSIASTKKKRITQTWKNTFARWIQPVLRSLITFKILDQVILRYISRQKVASILEDPTASSADILDKIKAEFSTASFDNLSQVAVKDVERELFQSFEKFGIQTRRELQTIQRDHG